MAVTPTVAAVLFGLLLAAVLALLALTAAGEYEAAALEREREQEALWDSWREEAREP